MMSVLIVSILISFILTVITLPQWIKKCKQIGLLWEDMNKNQRIRNVAASGGIVVVMSFVFGVLSYVAIKTFILQENGNYTDIFALLSVILILGIVGLIDDLLDWRKGGLSVRLRLFLALVSAIPLVVINAGFSEVAIPLLGSTDLGILYPLVFIPIGVAGATTTYNFLAGFNGLEAGQGVIIISFLSLVAYLTNNSWLAIIGLCMVASLLVFYLYNRYPAKVFPGDIMTYSVGALIACMAILGDFERIAVFVFIPYILETILKVRGKLKKQSFGRPLEDGSLDVPYDKFYSLNHISIYLLRKFKKKAYEKDVVRLIFAFQIIICLLALIIFKGALFI